MKEEKKKREGKRKQDRHRMASRMDVDLDDIPRDTSAGNVVSNRVYVGNLAFKTTWQTLKDHFKPCGKVLHADIFSNGGWSKVR